MELTDEFLKQNGIESFAYCETQEGKAEREALSAQVRANVSGFLIRSEQARDHEMQGFNSRRLHFACTQQSVRVEYMEARSSALTAPYLSFRRNCRLGISGFGLWEIGFREPHSLMAFFQELRKLMVAKRHFLLQIELWIN